jgi:glycerol uptake facilitator-like aquaporin
MSVGVGALVLLVVLVVGVAAGRSKRRFGLLLVGIIVIAVVGFVVTATTGGAVGPRAADLARLYSTALPPLVAFVAGWFCARGSWFTRIVVIAAAALLLAAFPYARAGEVTAAVLPQATQSG